MRGPRAWNRVFIKKLGSGNVSLLLDALLGHFLSKAGDDKSLHKAGQQPR
jgi:hypothetical protein